MTLREYLLNNKEKIEKYIMKNDFEALYPETFENKMFENDFEVLYAEAWDAEVFAKNVFKKSLNQVSCRDMYYAFRAAKQAITPYYFDDELENTNTDSYESNKMVLGEGSYKKLNLTYNENCEPSNEEDF